MAVSPPRTYFHSMTRRRLTVVVRFDDHRRDLLPLRCVGVRRERDIFRRIVAAQRGLSRIDSTGRSEARIVAPTRA